MICSGDAVLLWKLESLWRCNSGAWLTNGQRQQSGLHCAEAPAKIWRFQVYPLSSSCQYAKQYTNDECVPVVGAILEPVADNSSRMPVSMDSEHLMTKQQLAEAER